MMRSRAKQWPHGMTATATHDTKRGEDARARLIALAEIPGEWTSAVARWKLLNATHLVTDGEMRAPSATFEYMLYQALLGAWPVGGPDQAFTARMQQYALKAAREGKQETSWLNPHQAYEAGVEAFIARILDRSISGEFLASLETLAQRVSRLGALNSLGQITLKATMPGVPDFYQGTEFWDLSLVDPDNRRPVDFSGRAAVLAKIEDPDWDRLIQDWPDGHLKLAWIRHLLKLRSELADVFTNGDYRPLEITGPPRDHVIAFARGHGRDAVITAVARWFAPLSQSGRVWPRGDNFEGALQLGDYRIEDIDGENATGEVPLSALFRHLPVAVLRARVENVSHSRRKPSRGAGLKTQKAARDLIGPDGLADVVPTKRSRFPPPRSRQYSGSFITGKLTWRNALTFSQVLLPAFSRAFICCRAI